MPERIRGSVSARFKVWFSRRTAVAKASKPAVSGSTPPGSWSESAFLHVLELMPDGRWDVLWPRRNQTPVPVAAGERFTPPPIWQVGPPYGDNVLKVFASRTPIDFQWLLGSRQRTRGAGNPLEALFEEAMTPATRGSTARTTIAADGGVATAALTFQIVE